MPCPSQALYNTSAERQFIKDFLLLPPNSSCTNTAPCKVSSLFSSLSRQCPCPAHTPECSGKVWTAERGLLPEIQHVDKFLQVGIQLFCIDVVLNHLDRLGGENTHSQLKCWVVFIYIRDIYSHVICT